MKSLSRSDLAKLVASHLPNKGFVNLGIGAPTLIADYLPDTSEVMLHGENGVLNIGPKPTQGSEDWDLINPGKSPITIKTGASFFDSSIAFSMMRGGHIDIAVLGAFQVSQRGDLANWTTEENKGAPPAIGGAIDLAVGAKTIWVMMDHFTRERTSRIVKTCTLPLTAARIVSRIFTSVAIIDVTPNGLVVDALLEGLSFVDLQSTTEAELAPSLHPRTIRIDGTIYS